ncbi:MAG TPA: adenylate/guanylate cyclase domain-containing protein [Sulfuricella sp.]|nr:adenylate/guanylate cyclase domain-containing protein [Sulfuricella sp.]
MTRSIVEAMVKSGLTEGLKNPELLEFQIQEFAAGEYVCRSGDKAKELWIVIEGTVSVEIDDYPLRLPEFHPYQLMGEKGVIGRIKKRIAPLKASSHVTKLLRIRSEDIDTHPERHLIYRNIASINSSRVEAAHNEIEILSRDRRDKSELLKKYVGADVLNRRELVPDSFTNCSDEEVVIFFSDLVGFSSWSEGRDPADVATLLRGTLGIQSEHILEQGGFIDKFIGDGVMAYWPVFAGRRQEACDKAYRAASQIISSLYEIPMGHNHACVRIGLHVGNVFAGEFGTHGRVQYTVVGSEVNLAARLEQAKSGQCNGQEIPLGPIKASKAFVESLSNEPKANFSGPVFVDLKGIGRQEIFVNEALLLL